MRFILIFLGIIACTIACNKEAQTEVDTQPIVFTTISQGALYGNGEEGIDQSNSIIDNNSAWINLISKMETVNEASQDITNATINFDEQVVIAVFDEVRGNSGYSVSVTKIEENADDITVTITYTNTGGISNQVITQPYMLVSIPATNKEIMFVN